jgi:eukaryotic-like serine/threonine-protein kinase
VRIPFPPLPPPPVPPPPPAPDLSGIALDGRYELHALIGEGAFGRVYRGVDRRLDRPVAVKVIKPWWAEDPNWVRSFEREARVLASVNDPGIVQIFDVGSAPEGIYYVAEMVEGESLVERLRGGPLEPDEARSIAEQLARALASAHVRRVVHRDVKPANVLITDDGRVKVADFGVAQLAEGSSEGVGGTIVGTPRYMAPEQAQGTMVTPATDVYGVGIVLYEMLAGHPPFEGSSPVELAFRHVHDDPPPLPEHTPPALVSIVERALAKDPAERFPDGGAMARALEGAEEREPMRDAGARARGATAVANPPVRPASPPRKAPERTRVAPAYSPRRNVKPAARRRAAALLVGAILLVAGMIVAAILLTPGKVRVPSVHGLNAARVRAKLRRVDLRPSFAHRYSNAAKGTAIAQDPRGGSRADDGSAVRVTLSAGPAPVPVPEVVNSSTTAAEAALGRVQLRSQVVPVPAPGVTPGTVVKQSVAFGKKLIPGSTVVLSVAEQPHWRALTSFTGKTSVPFRIRGSRWQLVYSMSYQGTCTLIFICQGPTATVTNLTTGAQVDQFDLNDGSGKTRTLNTGPGVYQVTVAPGSDTSTWSMRAEDYY